MPPHIPPAPVSPAPIDPSQTGPWWRHGTLWLVIGGPALVVVASFITLGLAIRYPDPVVRDLSSSAEAAQDSTIAPQLAPAMKARNHAATGGTPAR